MVWLRGGLRAKVLGRLGRKLSPHPRASALSCPSSAIYGPGSLGRFTRPFAFPRPDTLSPLPTALPVGLLCPRTPARNTQRYEHPLAGVSCLSGRGYAELRFNGVRRRVRGSAGIRIRLLPERYAATIMVRPTPRGPPPEPRPEPPPHALPHALVPARVPPRHLAQCRAR